MKISQVHDLQNPLESFVNLMNISYNKIRHYILILNYLVLRVALQCIACSLKNQLIIS
jgi:hypothetical protein